MRRTWINKRLVVTGAAVSMAVATIGVGVSSGTSHAVPIDGVTALGDGYHHFVVQLSGDAVAPDSSAAGNTDPIVLAAGQNADEYYLPQLEALEQELPAQDLGPIYKDAQGNLRMRVAGQSATMHQAQISAYRQAIDTPASASVVQQLAKTPGIHSLDWILPGAAAVATHLSEKQVAALPGVVSVAPSPMSTVGGAASAPDNTLFSDQWGLENTGQPIWNGTNSVTGTAGDDADVVPAWTQSTGAGITVAVIDTGSQPDHPDLSGVYSSASGNVIGETAGTYAPTSTASEYYHGTFVTGIIAANTGSGQGVAGVAPGVKILEVKASDSGALEDSAVDAGIAYALDHGANIINLSLGSTDYDPTMEAEIQQAQADGVLVVVAAGNSGENIDPTSADPSDNTNPNTEYPAALTEPNIISVGSSDENDKPSSFSNYGASAVDLFAPGQDIYSTFPGSTYAIGDGTSFATPMVAAAAALVWAKDPSLTYAQVKADLMDTVTKVPALAGDSVAGGVLNTAAAVAAVSSDHSTSMVFDNFNAVTVGQTTASSVQASGTLPSDATGALAWRLSLGVETGSDGQAQAVEGEPITVDGQSYTTDADGQVIVAPSDLDASSLTSGTSLSLSASYPWAGTYALVAALVPASDPTGTAYSTQAVFFKATASGGGDSGTSPGGSSGGTPTASTPTASTPTASTPTASTPTASTPTGSTPASSGSTPAGSGSTPTASTPTSSTPTASTPASSGSTPATTSSGGSSGDTSPPPDVTIPPTSTPTTPTDPPTDTTEPTTPAPSSGSGPQPPASEPITPSAPSSGGGDTGSTPSSGTPSTGGGDTGSSPSPSPTGVFGLTSVAPASGSTAGGEPVTVYGTAIPANAGVLIGGQATQLVAQDTPTSIEVVAPALDAGTYDVEVCATDGTCDTLPGAYTATASSTTTTPGSSGGGGGEGGSTGSSGSSPSTGGGSSGSTPSTGGGSTPSIGSSGSSGSSGSTPSTGGGSTGSTPSTGSTGSTPSTGDGGGGTGSTGSTPSTGGGGGSTGSSGEGSSGGGSGAPPTLGTTSVPTGSDLAASDPGMWDEELATQAAQPGVVIF